VTGLCIYTQIYLRRHLRFKASLDHSSINRSPYVHLDRRSIPSLEGFAKRNVQDSADEDEEIDDCGPKADGSAEDDINSKCLSVTNQQEYVAKHNLSSVTKSHEPQTPTHALITPRKSPSQSPTTYTLQQERKA